MAGNDGLIGFPTGNRIMDAASDANFGSVAFGASVHYVNLPVTPDALQTGYLFRYIPVVTNPGAVDIYINGIGPFSLCKAIRTDSADVIGTIITLTGGEIHPGGTLFCMFRNDTLIEAIDGLNWQPTNFGLDMGNAASAAIGRGVLGLANGATTTVGTAATRNVGTAVGQLTEVIDGAGSMNPSLNIANRDLQNLFGSGVQRTVWAAISFNGVSLAVFSTFNSVSVARIGVGRYTLTFPGVGGVEYNCYGNADISGGTSTFNIIAGTRTATSVGVVVGDGNNPFDFVRVTATIIRVA